MKIKPIITILLLGTSLLGANAQSAQSASAASSQKADLHWKYSQSDQNVNPNQDPNVVRYSPVPEAQTILVGAVLLMPLGVSLLRNLRRGKKPAA